MLIVHEGIPGSGKTFEAVSEHLIKGLTKERHVFARIDELNYQQLADLAGIPLEKCDELLHQLSVEEAMQIQKVEMPIGSLVLLDEVQNYFPDDRKRLPDDVMAFVAEHRHKGLDIILMCQDLRDVHKIWRRRVDTKIVFTKLDMLGGKGYRWKLYKAVAPERFKEVSAGERKYDPKVFGSYKSFEAGAEAAQKYDDKRRSIWSSKFFRYGLPLAVVVGGFAIFYLVHALKGGGLAKSLGGKAPVESSVKGVAPGAGPVPAAGGAPPPAAAAPAPKVGEKDFVSDLCERYRVRLSGVMRNAKGMTAVIEWYDEGLHLRERLTMLTVARLGYSIVVDDSDQFATIKRGSLVYIATQFPIDVEMKVSERTQEAIANKPPVAADVGGGGRVLSLDKPSTLLDTSAVPFSNAEGPAVPRVRKPGGAAAIAAPTS